MTLTLAADAEPSTRRITIGLAGDSTVADYPADRELQGWGQALVNYLDAGRADLQNHARGGRSSRSFINENRWQSLLDARPDYILIQFGHNDHPGKGPNRETLPDPVPDTLPAEGPGSHPMDWYRNNLRTYITQARASGAVPVVVTPMERRSFDQDTGRIRAGNRP